MTHLSFIQSSIDLPEVFSEEVFSNGLSVDPDPLPDLYQMWRAATTRETEEFTTLFLLIKVYDLSRFNLSSSVVLMCGGW